MIGVAQKAASLCTHTGGALKADGGLQVRRWVFIKFRGPWLSAWLEWSGSGSTSIGIYSIVGLYGQVC